jgi:hypothetical protein
MYQAISTKFLGPTNTRGARVKASAQAGSVTVLWDHALNVDDNHTVAARALAEKYGWQGAWIAGGAADGTGNVYVRLASGAGLKGAAGFTL